MQLVLLTQLCSPRSQKHRQAASEGWAGQTYEAIWKAEAFWCSQNKKKKKKSTHLSVCFLLNYYIISSSVIPPTPWGPGNGLGELQKGVGSRHVLHRRLQKGVWTLRGRNSWAQMATRAQAVGQGPGTRQPSSLSPCLMGPPGRVSISPMS